jgi:NAD/NADP transhydrogenase alpha subunit
MTNELLNEPRMPFVVTMLRGSRDESRGNMRKERTVVSTTVSSGRAGAGRDVAAWRVPRHWLSVDGVSGVSAAADAVRLGAVSTSG